MHALGAFTNDNCYVVLEFVGALSLWILCVCASRNECTIFQVLFLFIFVVGTSLDYVGVWWARGLRVSPCIRRQVKRMFFV